MKVEIIDVINESAPVEDAPRIMTYKKYYTGRMYPLFWFSPRTHLSLSHPGDFGNGQEALIHLEDEKGNSKDMLFPSLKVLESHGDSEDIRKLMVFAERSGKAIRASMVRHSKAKPSDILIGRTMLDYSECHLDESGQI